MLRNLLYAKRPNRFEVSFRNSTGDVVESTRFADRESARQFAENAESVGQVCSIVTIPGRRVLRKVVVLPSATCVFLIVFGWSRPVITSESQGLETWEHRTVFMELIGIGWHRYICDQQTGDILKHGPLTKGVPNGDWQIWNPDRHGYGRLPVTNGEFHPYRTAKAQTENWHSIHVVRRFDEHPDKHLLAADNASICKTKNISEITTRWYILSDWTFR